MNAVIALRDRIRTAMVPDAAPRAEQFERTEPAPEPRPAQTSAMDERLLGVERAASFLAPDDATPVMSRMFCAAVFFSGQEFPIKTLLSAIHIKGLQAGSGRLLSAMANLGFYSSRRPFRYNRWKRRKLPVLFEERGGPVLLLATEKEAILYDGISGKPCSPQDLSLDGRQVWTFEYDSLKNAFSDAARTHTGYSWARAMLSRFPHLATTTILSSLMLTLTGIAVSAAISMFYGQVIALASLSSLPYLIVGFALIVIFEAIFTIQRSNIVAWVASRLDYLVNVSSFARILKISPFFSERASPTSQAARLRSFEGIRDFVSGPSFASILDIPVAMLSLLILFFIAPDGVFVLLISIGTFLFVTWISWRRTKVLTSLAADDATEMQRIAIETLDKLEMIRNQGLQNVWSRRIAEIADREQNAQMRLRFASLVTETLSTIIYTISVIALMAEGAVLVWGGQLTGAMLLALTILGLRILLPFHTLCLSVSRFEQIRRSLQQINQLMNLATEVEHGREKNEIEPLSGRFSLVNIGFRAADTRPVFVGLELDVEPGEIVGIFGANGTGKTTVLKMIMGMVDIVLGTVRIDGMDLRQLPLHELRRRISYVPQRPRIFPGTLRQNLAYANPLTSAAQIEEALQAVGLTEAIAQLPNGLDHQIVGPDEELFSESFRYRFAIARALLVNSRLMLIDEIPNGLLDGETGELLRRILREFRGRRTVVFVSHRLDFLREANRVIALRYGKVPIVTRPNALMEKDL